MGVKELKERIRSLLAWILVFSLVVGVTLFGVPEVVVAEETTKTPTGVVLNVPYYTGGETYEKTQTYPQYYVDEVAETVDETVTVTTLTESEAGFSDSDRKKLIVWKDSFGTMIVPGDTVDYNWNNLNNGESLAEVSMSALVLTYTTPGDYNYYPVSEMGDLTLNYNNETETFTITMPEAVTVRSGKFVRWVVTSGNNTYYAEAGGTLTTSDKVEATFAYDNMELSVEVEWVPMATVMYYESYDNYGTVLDEV